jgi:hypothetical protein
MIDAYVPISTVLPEGIWPEALAENGGGTFLDKVACLIFDDRADEFEYHAFIRGKVMIEARIPLPFLQGMDLVFGKGDSEETGLIDVDLTLSGQENGPPIFELKIVTTTLSLSLSRDIFTPVEIAEVDGQLQVTPLPGNVAIPLPFAMVVRFDGTDWTFDFEVPAGVGTGLTLPLCSLGDSGVMIEAIDIELNFSGNGTRPAGASAGWKGLYLGSLKLYIPQLFNGHISATSLGIGTGGLWGEFAATFALHYSATSSPHFTGDLATSLFGIEGGLSEIRLSFEQSIPNAFELKGSLLLPFFDEPVNIEIGIEQGGRFTVALSSNDGLYRLNKPGVLELELESIGFEIAGGIFTAKLSGQLTPLFGEDQGLIWPSFNVNELSIDSEGHIRLDGGWMDLPDQYSLDFHGFKLEITQLGFGKTDDGGKWIGFSGGLKLVDGFKAGASVEGLRVTWYDDGRDTKITLNGVGVEFEIPDVVRFKGDVSYRELTVTTQDKQIETVRRFDGDIELNLISLNLEIDATLVIGSATGDQGTYTFFAIYVDVELPTGIPLASTGVALYGFAGLFALQMEPDKQPDEEWYEGWFKRPDVGVTDLKKKWVNRRDSLAFGAGVTIGTQSDNGYTFAGRVLLVIVFPGPIVQIEGKANLLKERAKLDEGEPTFRSLAVIDNREKTFLMGLDAFYRTDETDGKLLDIRGGVEAFFDFKDASAWHIYIGEREPREKRIRAKIFQLFEANSYFMIDAHQLATGAWLGYSKGYKFGPLKVSLEAWIEGNAVISWKPTYFHGDLWMHGSAELSAFGVGLGLTADARFAADVFDPFHVVGELSVGIKVPLRKKRLEADLKFEWGPEPGQPPLPLPLKEISIEHLKVTTTWPLDRGTLLLPNYDSNGDGFLETPSSSAQENEPPPLDLPIVPMDCRPHISFGRTVHDRALIGVNAQPVVPPEERIGDPAKNEGPVSIRYSLDGITLSKWDDAKWKPVARKSTNANDAGVRTIFGSWAPVPSLPAGNLSPGTDPPVSNSKLWLWSLTPFDYTRHSGDDFNNWFVENFPHYPCIPKLSDREICCDFERIERTQPIRSPLKCVDHPEISIEWLAPDFTSATILEQPIRGDFISVTILKGPIRGLTHALCFPRGAPKPIVLLGGAGLEGEGVVESDDNARSEVGSGLPVGSTVAIRLSEPASRVTLVVTQENVTSPTNIGFLGALAGKGSNPRIEKGVRFEARDSSARPLVETRIDAAPTVKGPMMGLRCEQELELILPCASAFVQLTLTHSARSSGVGPASRAAVLPASPVTIRAFNEDGTIAASRNIQSPEQTPEAIRLTGTAIKRVVITTLGIQVQALSAVVAPPPLHDVWLHELWFDCSGASQILATGIDNQRNTYGPFSARDHLIEVVGKNIKLVQIQSNGEICLLRVCATIPPDPDEVDERDKMAKHLVEEMTRWSGEGEVLEPDTTYRLNVVTSVNTTDGRNKVQSEYAYFRTGGPPGLTKLKPKGPGKSEKLDSGLNDLSRYVRQTTPATVPPVGDKPVMAKPFYRAYDIGVEFNERYVDLMYRMAGRDLGLYLYDNNNRAARDAEGRLIVANNAWDTTEELTLTESDALWIKLVNERQCDPTGSIDMQGIPHNKTLTSAGEGQVLDGDTLYEARLVPLLLRETFSGYAVGATANGPLGNLGRWAVDDSGGIDGPSHWEVREEGAPPGKYLIQTSNIRGGSNDAGDPNKPGTVLFRADSNDLPAGHADQPSNWTDYCLSAYMRSASDRAIGLVFRYLDGDHYYRFSMDRMGQYRRLVSVVNGEQAILTEDDFVYDLNRDYLITVEAIGSSLRVYQDSALVFDVSDPSIERGSIGLYSWNNTSARFGDVRLNDFRKQAPTVYSFKFTTSLFADFFHHLHSFQDETWTVELGSLADVQSLVSQAVPPATEPSEAEARAYDALADRVLGPSARRNPARVEVTRVEQGGEVVTLLVQSPEPIDWNRTSLEILHTGLVASKPELASAVKLTDITFGATQPNEESVTLLLREAVDLTGCRIERLALPGVSDPIGSDDSALLRDRFADGDMTGWTIVDEGAVKGPSIWSVNEGAFQQTSNINSKPHGRAGLSKQGTQAVAGDPAWTDVIISARLLSVNDDGAIGIVFRRKDETNYYRFSMDSRQAYRRLVKNVGGEFTLLWEDDFAYERGRAYEVDVVAIGGSLRGYIDGERIFEVADTDLASGRVGLYCFRNTDAQFSEVRVASPEWTPYYAFEHGPRLPAGTRVLVYAGNEADAPAQEPGVVRRFIASGANHGLLRLSAVGADLRIRASDGAGGHARRFWPDADYAPVAAQVLRKADGTGFFVFVPSATPAGSALAVGEYRLRMTYRRDNRAIDPGSQLLSEAGNESDERATINIPW